MKRLFLYSLFLLFPFTAIGAQEFYSLSAKEYPITSQSIPTFTTALEVGGLEGKSSHQISLLYPEYEPLTSHEIRQLKRQGFTPPTNISIQQEAGAVQKKELLHISFVPFLQKEGQWLRLSSFKLHVSPKTTALAKAAPLSSTNTSASRYAAQSVLASGKWVKIRVEKEGIYQLTHSQLSSMGFSDPNKVKLYGYGGKMLPEIFTFRGDNALIDDLQEVPLFRRDGALLFFSEGVISWKWNTSRWVHTNNPYSSYAYYFLTEGENPLPFPQLPQVAPTREIVSSVLSRALYEKDSYSWFHGGREFVDSYNFAQGNKKTFSLSLPNIAPKSIATVDVSFTAANISAITTVSIEANSAPLGTMSIGTYGSYQDARLNLRSYKTTALTENSNFAFTTTAGHNARLDYIRVSYPRLLSAHDNGYAFTLQKATPVTLQVAHANKNTRIWRLGNANNSVAEVAGTLEQSTYIAPIDAPSRQYVIVDIGANYPSPTVVGKVSNQNLHADGAADMIILLPPSQKYQQQAERLADAHRKEGLRVRLVNAGQLYNEFSSGTPDAMAYRRYLKMLYDRATTPADAPKYLLLFGGSIWDNRRVTSEAKSVPIDDYLLAYEESSTPYSTDFFLGTLDSYVTDDIFGLLDDNEGINPKKEYLDLAIGRFPCSTEAEAKLLVDKTLSYMNNEEVGNWKNTISFLGDEGDKNLHMNGAESVIQQMYASTDSLFVIKKYYWDAYARATSATGNNYPQVTQLLKEQMKRGSLIFNYMGHGSPHQISHSQLLKTKDFEENVSRTAPLWIFASCEITPYDQIEKDLGRMSLFNPKGGSVALLCASRAVYASSNTSLNISFVKHALDGNNTLGEALRLAKVEMVSKNLDKTENKMKYCLFADPALRLKRPLKGVVVDSINGKAINSFSAQQLKAGSVVRFSGHIAENNTLSSDFKGTITATLFDREQTISCRNNKKEDTSPMRYQDRGEAVYQGTDSVRNGRFSIRMVVPRNISYTNDRGRLYLYAVNNERTKEFNGANSQFYFNGTDPSLSPDTLSPKLFIYLNSPDFPNGGTVGSSALFGAKMNDDAGINAVGAIGHHMELIIDNNYAEAIPLNDYFSYDFGSYQSGELTYALSNLPKGKHQLTFRIWDVNDNSTTASLDFYVGDMQEYDVYTTSPLAKNATQFAVAHPDLPSRVTVEVHDLTGKKVWSAEKTTTSANYTFFSWNLTAYDDGSLPTGVYLYTARIVNEKGEHLTETKKIIRAQQ